MKGLSRTWKNLAKIAETGLGSYIFSAIMGFFVGALPRQRDDFNIFTRSEALHKLVLA